MQLRLFLFIILSIFISELIVAQVNDPAFTRPIKGIEERENRQLGNKKNHGILVPVDEVEKRIQSEKEPGAAGIIVRTEHKEVSEAGSSTNLLLKLKSKPLENTTLRITAGDSSELELSLSQLTFSPANWSEEQICKVKGLDDDVVDGDTTNIIRIEVIRGDFRYSGLRPVMTTIIVKDDDTAGLELGKISGDTDEKGKQAKFSVVLRSSPQAPVSIPVISSNRSEGTAKPEMLIFSKKNWNRKQWITVTGQNDFRQDEDTNYSIKIGPTASKDKHYNNLEPPAVRVINRATSATMRTVEHSRRSNVVTSKSEKTTSSGSNITSGIPFQLQPLKDIPSATPSYKLRVDPTSAEVSENGTRVQLRIQLESPVLTTIPLLISTDDPTEISIEPENLVFHPNDWDQPQIVTIRGMDDRVADGEQKCHVIISLDQSKAQQFIRLNSTRVAVTNTDNDQPGFYVGKYQGFTDENGSQSEIPIRLMSQPLYPVEITLQSDSPKEAEIRTPTLIFKPGNWDVFQQVVVVGKNDFIADGDTPFSVIAKKIKSKDKAYHELPLKGINLVNREIVAGANNVRISGGAGNTVGIGTLPVSAESGGKNEISKPKLKEIKQATQKADYSVVKLAATSSESGGEAELEVKLNAKPTDAVTIKLSSSNTAEGVVKPEELRFTVDNWNKPQRVKVKGQNDDIKDGDVVYQVFLQATSSRDYRFSRLSRKSIKLVNLDNDEARLVVSSNQLQTTENGNKAAVKVHLGSKPSSEVRIPVASSNVNEGIASPAVLVFGPENWQIPQTIIVVGQDDLVADLDKIYTITLGPAKSDDSNYADRVSGSLKVVNKDNDTAALKINYTNTATSEGGRAVNVRINLQTQPRQKVVLKAISTNRSEGIPKPSKLIFDATNWKYPQTIQIVGQNDEINDGDIDYQVKLSTQSAKDPRYRELPDKVIKLINEDDDRAGIRLGEVSGRLSENGDEAAFSVRLRSQPLHDVLVSLKSSNRNEGIVLNNQLQFSPKNWSVAQSVKVKGQDDSIADGNKPIHITAEVKRSKDPRYELLDPVNIELVNQDNDKAGFRIIQPKGKTSENGDQTTFSIALTSKPSAKVTIGLNSNDQSEGTISIRSLSFTPKNWNQPQRVTVSGVNDQLVDGEQNYAIVLQPAKSDDKSYNGIDPPDVQLSNLDNNLTTFFVSKIHGNTSESGRKVSFNVRLNAAPKGKVTIKIVSDQPQEAAPDLDMLWFDSSNWDQNQKVTISGYDDFIDDGDIPYQITITSSSDTDPAYMDIPPVNIKLFNRDNDECGILVKPINKMSSESGEEAKFSVRLTSEPTSSVVLLFESTNPGEGKLITKHAAFLSHNWDKEQIIRVKGVADYLVDGNQEFAITSSGAVSSDPLYNKLPFEKVKLVNKDMDEARFIIGALSGDTTEAGENATFTVRLSSKPRAPVLIGLKSDNPQEGRVDKNRLKFDESNWDKDQVVTITGIDDFIKDEDKRYHIVFSSSVSDDGHFHGLSPRWISLKNLDNKKLTIGLYPFYAAPLGSFAEDFDATLGYALNGGYVWSGYVTITAAYQSVSLTGTPERSLYGDMHKVEQTLTLNNLAFGLKIVLVKQPIQFSVEPFLSLVNWNYHSTTLTDGTEQENQGQDFAAGIKAGIDYPLYESLFLESGIHFMQLTGGLGNRQLLMLGAGLYLPF
ncbi:MAG: hypothetical protein MJE63_11870 [Proteobacteria bacterium]|nr:hypothetical protein [Pseudomonadota bacterium]